MKDLGQDRSSYLSPRLPAFKVPCPCSSLSPRVASLGATAGLSTIFLLWSIGSWLMYQKVNELKAFVDPSTSAFVEMRNMATFVLTAAWFWSTLTLVSFSAFVSSCFPQRDVAKHLSRTIWLAWTVTWALAVYGMAAHLSADAWLQAGCERGDTCETYRRRLQVWLMVDLFVTLALVFWFALVYSAFVHSLHPHVYYTGDADSDLDEYDYARILEEKLRESSHPLAIDALERIQAARTDPKRQAFLSDERAGPYERQGFRSEESDSYSSLSGSDEEKGRRGLITAQPVADPERGQLLPSSSSSSRSYRSSISTDPSRTVPPPAYSTGPGGLSDLSEASDVESVPSRQSRTERELGRTDRSRSKSRSRSVSRARSRSHGRS